MIICQKTMALIHITNFRHNLRRVNILDILTECQHQNCFAKFYFDNYEIEDVPRFKDEIKFN